MSGLIIDLTDVDQKEHEASIDTLCSVLKEHCTDYFFTNNVAYPLHTTAYWLPSANPDHKAVVSQIKEADQEELEREVGERSRREWRNS